MKIVFSKLHTYSGMLTYSFNRGILTHRIKNEIALRDGIHINEDECEDLDDIRLSGTELGGVQPDADEIVVGSYKVERRFKKGINLSELAEELSKVSNTPDKPLTVKVLPAGSLWTKAELSELNSIINNAKVYIDLTPTNLNHEFDQELLDELCEEELNFWGEQDWVLSETNTYDDIDLSESSTYTELCLIENDEGLTEIDSNSRNLLKPFSGVFSGNKYITGITFPSNDNFSVGGVFAGCTNLKHVHFSDETLYKVTVIGVNDTAKYYLYEGQEGFLRKQDEWINILDSEEEFIDKLVTKAAAISYYYYWPDCTDHPILFWTKGQGPEGALNMPDGNEFDFVGTKNLQGMSVMALPKNTIVNNVILTSPNNEEVTPAVAVDYDSDIVEAKDGVIYLDGLDEE